MVRNGLLLLHLLSAIAWLGGMFFAHFCLRPAAVKLLAPPQRLPLMTAALGSFLRYMAVAVTVLVLTGLAMFMDSGWARAPLGWQVMLVVGLAMAAVFGYVYGVHYPRLRARCEAGAWAEAAQVLNRIRQLVVTNLVLGLVVVVAAASAR
ncbi:CopD family protein [Ramlibacter tataouinensis]|uniref:Copper resistance protein D domain-containing protein n=1 Tax=Ramlibacter tataouinensis TaxID=94132 RepID=A0A127JVJ3_9BURK|nr:CopD family protein [Ramlibacter tataouinensis]AMO23899.1 hypothetical protein UC35_14795 [Ramlibacter tataouinensis]